MLSQGGRRSLTSLAQRMTANFCAGVCATGGHKWEVIGNAAETAKIMIRKSMNNPGEPSGAVLSATMSVWMPMPHQRLFALMLNEELRSQWDVLSPGSAMQNMIRFSKGQDPGNPNTISLLRANVSNHGLISLLLLACMWCGLAHNGKDKLSPSQNVLIWIGTRHFLFLFICE